MESLLVADVSNAVEDLKTQMFDTITQIVQIPSVVGNEGPAQDFMADFYRDAGFEVDTFIPQKPELTRHAAFVDSELPFAGRPNVIARLPGDETCKSMLLNGHIDVVSPEPLDRWTRDPWGGVIEGNRLYGRGALDMKGGLIANAFAVKALLKSGHRPKGEVVLQSVIEEEAGGGGGTLACLMEGHTADGMIIPEPHPILCVAHVGLMYFRVRVSGRTAHAGRGHTGVNAIGKMVGIYQALARLDEERQARVRFPLFQIKDAPACHLNIGKMVSGDWPSTVPGSAEITCRISFVPGETMASVRELIQETVDRAASEDAWLREHPPVIEWFGWKAEPWFQNPEDPFVKMVLGNVQNITGRPMTPEGNTAGLDNRFSSYFNFPSVCYGPGGGFIHSCDEFVDLDSLVTATKVIALSTLEWCASSKES